MSDFHALPFLSIPPDILIALDNRPYRFAIQPIHHLLRMAHIISISGFFGAICILDLRLAGVRPSLALRSLSVLVLPWVYATFAIGVVTGSMLFFYDPVHVASHAYFSLKIILIVLGMANAAVFNVKGFKTALSAAGPLPLDARIVGAASLAIWLGVMICASLNVEAAPKVLLR